MVTKALISLKILLLLFLLLPFQLFCGKLETLTDFLATNKKLAYATLGTTSVMIGMYSIYNAYFNKIKTVSEDKKLPLIFHSNYDISFFGIEKVHPFDTRKYGRVVSLLKNFLHVTNEHFHKPQQQVSRDDLLSVHTSKYIDSLKQSLNIQKIAEIPLLRFVPNFLLQWRLLVPMRYATQGTIDAAFLALDKGVAINLSGGYHHAKTNQGGGFCFYADIPLAIKKLREKNPELKVLYIDLDAHQGNGVEECLKEDEKTCIIDCYNEKNYPRDIQSAKRINVKITAEDIYCSHHKKKSIGSGFTCKNCNDTYLKVIKKNLNENIQLFEPDIIFYNAGTDCFEEDLIGVMALNEQGIIKRDKMVFRYARKNKIPLCMTLSGGYSKKSATIIANSISNLHQKGLLNPLSE